jgi:hypothetical protein
VQKLTERQQKILACINAFLGETSRQDIIEDSIIVAKIAVDLATVAGQPGFDPTQIEDLAVGFILQYTAGIETPVGVKPVLN